MSKKPKKQEEKKQPLLRLDLGCGKNRKQGFIGVDAIAFEGVDQVLNLVEREAPKPYKYDGAATAWAGMQLPFKPWPWADGSVEEVHSSHFLEHLTGEERVHFFNELYRVMIPGGKATISVPHWSSERAYGDPTHKWPPVVFFSLYYLDKAWREVNAPHCGYTCDFPMATGGNNIDPAWTTRTPEVQRFAQTHYINVSHDLIFTVTKK